MKMLEDKVKNLEDGSNTSFVKIATELSLHKKLSTIIRSHFAVGVTNHTKAFEISEILKSDNFLSGVTPQFFHNDIQDIYTPQACLKVIDLSGGTLNYCGYHKLRSIEFRKRKKTTTTYYLQLRDSK